MKYEKIEHGVMLMWGGKAWGTLYDRGGNEIDAWIDPESAKVRDPKFCAQPKDLAPITITSRNRHIFNEVMKGKIMHVKKTTTIEVDE